MTKITLRVRAGAVLAGVSLAAAAVVAGGGPALAGGRPMDHQGLRAAMLAQILRHGRTVPEPGKVPKPGKSSVLNGVFCTASDNCWAVGGYTPRGSELNQILRWNGRKWSLVTGVPSPGGAASGHFSVLEGVRCTSARNCWAVGDYYKGGADLNQALHWNGAKWSLVPTPTPGGTLSGDENELFDVVCPSTSSCWAGGEYGTEGANEIILNEVLHWNGKTWSMVHVPNPGGTAQADVQAVDGIRCTSTRYCLAVGTYGNLKTLTLANEALRWNGTRWSKVTTPNPQDIKTPGDVNELIGLGCATASNCWAAGTDGVFNTQTYQNEVLHWNGKKWSQQTTPDPDGTGTGASNQLSALNCISATSCWAVGSYGSVTAGTGEILNQALRWNGKKWSLAATPNPAGTANKDENELSSIRCTSPGFCWTVGLQENSGGTERNEALRWNGAKWSSG
jgi:hypothetical protein